jgi:CHAT domain-containing protein
MRRFYEVRQTPRKVSKAEALRLAQLEMVSGKLSASTGAERGMKRDTEGTSPLPGWTHPYYWAPFILLGNGR